MSSFRTVKLWTCCSCRETGISMTIVDCPACEHSRCIDCNVKAHVDSDADIEEENRKGARSTTQDKSRKRKSNQTESSTTEGPPRRQGFGTTGISEGGSLSTGNTISDNEDQYPLICIAPEIKSQSIYVLRKEMDKDLISAWHRSLSILSSRCRKTSHHLVSIHLFRMGPSETESKPTIIVNTSVILDRFQQNRLQHDLSKPVSNDDTHEDGIFPTNFLSLIQLVFQESTVRRSIYSPPLPPICQPRNRHYSEVPATGASIGIQGSTKDTATLAGYLVVDSIMMALTVDHLIPTNESIQVSITHISEQDRYDVLIPRLSVETRNLVRQISHTCQFCSQLQLPGARDKAFDQFSRLVLDEDPIIESCSLNHTLRAVVLSNIDAQYKVRPFGCRYAQSGPRRRMEGAVPREMDWALFCVMFLGLPECRYNNLDPRGENELHVSNAILPGALIKSVGRTSGYQVGQISTTASRIFHGSYVTEEWCVINRPETAVDEWVEGGIGVDGDSGGLIVDQDSNAVYGMLWGRTGDGPTTMTLFTPMSEILSDICERTNSRVHFFRGQEIPKFDRKAEERISEVPVVQQGDETERRYASVTGAISYLDIAQPSLSERIPYRRFERYRGDDVEKRSVTNVNTQWPGTHTYLRYVLGEDAE